MNTYTAIILQKETFQNNYSITSAAPHKQSQLCETATVSAKWDFFNKVNTCPLRIKWKLKNLFHASCPQLSIGSNSFYTEPNINQ